MKFRWFFGAQAHVLLVDVSGIAELYEPHWTAVEAECAVGCGSEPTHNRALCRSARMNLR